MRESLYYRHSGQFSLGSVIVATVAAGVAGAVLAAVYAAVILYIPLAGFVTFVLSIGFGVLLGLVIGRGLKWAKVRHEGVVFFSSAVASLSAFYVSWAVWTWLLIERSDVGAGLLAILPEPGVVWALLAEINAVGAWSMSGFTPTGPVLWVLWGLEALLILAPAMLVPFGVLAVPFCERCELWCEPETDVARLASCEQSQLKDNVESKRFDLLQTLGSPGVEDDTWIRADLHHCPSCGNLHTLTLKAVQVSVGDNGARDERDEEIVNQLLVTTQEAELVRAL